MADPVVVKEPTKPAAIPEPLPTTSFPKPLTDAEIAKLPPELLKLVDSVMDQLGDLSTGWEKGISEEELRKMVTTSILGREGSWKELGEDVAKSSRETLDKEYHVHKGASEDERAKIIAKGIGEVWQGRIGNAEDFLKKFEGVDGKGDKLHSAAADEEALKAAEKRTGEIVGKSLGLSLGASIEEMKAELKRQQDQILADHKAGK